MDAPLTPTPADRPLRDAIPQLLAATLVLAIGLGVVWLVIVPIPPNQLCPAIYPAPAYCTEAGRRSAGAFATIPLVLAYLLTLGSLLVPGPWRRPLSWTAVGLFAFVGWLVAAAVPSMMG